ncbi:MAG: serine/threonine-protein kinase, partial [Planctomycetota bacterium]
DVIMGRSVAMKRLLPEAADDPDEQRRFLREARVTAQLQHPNTVPVYEIGRDDEGGIYFTMKKISGENFFEVLKRIAKDDEETAAKFPISNRLDVIADACLALAYAHAHGVVHRDFKPENIWVGAFGEVILLDWGIAKVWGHEDDFADDPTDHKIPLGSRLDSLEDEAGMRTLTRTGQLLGTPLYMSPEQVLGHKYLDERTDIFSVGIVLYEALCFVEPFRGRDIRTTFDNIIHEPPVPPHIKRPEAGIPEEAGLVAMRALAKKPDERYQSVLQLVDELRMAARAAE